MSSSSIFSSVQRALAGRDGARVPPAGLLLLAGVSICISLALPAGFAGWDDLHYVRAAQSWLAVGVHVPANHWGTRLPYVLTLAASMRLFGLTVLALTVPNTILFVLLLLLLWRIADQVYGGAAAFCAALVVVTTPLFVRMPTTYYPEVMEATCAAGATALVLSALPRPSLRGRAWLLVAAGLCGGCGILVRQTALAMPVALSVLIALSDRTQRRRILGSVLLLAAGYATPVVLESLFYLLLTGHPLERLQIDSRHVLIASAHLRGGTYSGGSPLFNWDLESRWDVPSLIRAPWMINPLLRVFTSPGLLLTPSLCLLGGLVAWRLPGRGRDYALFAGTGLLLQYLLNTFVLAIAPDTRYFAVSVALAMPLAGLLLSQLRLKLLIPAAALLAVPTLLVMLLEPSPAHLMPALQRFASGDQPVHVSPELHDAATILLADHPEIARHVTMDLHRSEVPVGDLAVVDAYGWTGAADHGCGGGVKQWQPVDSSSAAGPVSTVLDHSGLGHLLPPSLSAHFDRRQDRLKLVRRAC